MLKVRDVCLSFDSIDTIKIYAYAVKSYGPDDVVMCGEIAYNVETDEQRQFFYDNYKDYLVVGFIDSGRVLTLRTVQCTTAKEEIEQIKAYLHCTTLGQAFNQNAHDDWAKKEVNW